MFEGCGYAARKRIGAVANRRATSRMAVKKGYRNAGVRPPSFRASFLPAPKLSKFKIALNTRK